MESKKHKREIGNVDRKEAPHPSLSPSDGEREFSLWIGSTSLKRGVNGTGFHRLRLCHLGLWRREIEFVTLWKASLPDYSRWMMSWSQVMFSAPVKSVISAVRATAREIVVLIVAVWDAQENRDMPELS